MKCFFDSCHEAVEHTDSTKSFGAFYSEKKNQNRELHIHNCCELFFCIRGGHSMLIDDRVYTVNDGDLFVINQFQTHKVVPDRGDVFERYILHVHPSFLYSNSIESTNLSECFYGADRAAKVSLSPEETAHLIGLFEMLHTECEYGDALYKKIRALDIILEVGRLFATHNATRTDDQSYNTVQLAIDYINNNYFSELTLADIAKNSFVSPAHLSRLFKTYCGTTVGKYIIGKRITEAKKLLAEGKSVTDTAFACGFNDYANFIRSFKHAVGVPPGKYRSEL